MLDASAGEGAHRSLVVTTLAPCRRLGTVDPVVERFHPCVGRFQIPDDPKPPLIVVPGMVAQRIEAPVL